MQHVPADQSLESSAPDTPDELLRVDVRVDPIVVAPQNEGRRRHTVQALLETLVRNRPDELPHGGEPLRLLDLRRDVLLLVLWPGAPAACRIRLGIAPEEGVEVGRGQHDHIGDRLAVDPQAERRNEAEFPDAARTERRQLCRDHGAEEVSRHERRVQAKGSEQLVVRQREIDHVVELFHALGALNAGVKRRVHGEPLGQSLEQRRPAASIVEGVAVDQRRSAPRREHAEFHHAVSDRDDPLARLHRCPFPLPAPDGHQRSA